jgi:hypothetical protein
MGLPNVDGIVQQDWRDVVSVLSQFIARTMPESGLRGFSFAVEAEPGGVETLFVHLDDRRIPLFTGRMQIPTAYTPNESEYDPVESDD